MEYHEIGERFEYNGVLLEVSVSTDGCAECFFSKEDSCISSFPINCSMHERNNPYNYLVLLLQAQLPYTRTFLLFRGIPLFTSFR